MSHRESTQRCCPTSLTALVLMSYLHCSRDVLWALMKSNRNFCCAQSEGKSCSRPEAEHLFPLSLHMWKLSWKTFWSCQKERHKELGSLLSCCSLRKINRKIASWIWKMHCYIVQWNVMNIVIAIWTCASSWRRNLSL